MNGRTAGLVALFMCSMLTPLRAENPRAPAGQDPGGEATAFITTGIDYTRPAIAKCLARDGEGEPIGWDFADNDARPFAADPADTALAETTCRQPGVRLVAIRVNPNDPLTLGKAVVFMTKSPAKTAILTLGPLPQAAWEPFRQAMLHFKDAKVLVPRCAPMPSSPANAADILPEALGLPNVAAAPCGN
jgi:hypothetical protein